LYTISLPALCTPSLSRSDALPYPLKTIRFRDGRLSDTDNHDVLIHGEQVNSVIMGHQDLVDISFMS
ncbi:TPA: hypothetical protein ACN7S0_003819, partial [Klebsiella pneumoniae]